MKSQTLRYAAKALIIEKERLLCLRKEGDIGKYYVLPGGGQEPGELLPDTLARECLEELGAKVEVGRLRFVQEYVGDNHLFKDLHGKMHFVNLYFECRLLEPALTHPLVSRYRPGGTGMAGDFPVGRGRFFPARIGGTPGAG